ncbi:TMEM175 family protein [Conyzicola sp.]|uniref:TMEM175 family protein n=1 Tax=Conyzicola sp. TaxID=1969404 RepID=UPI003988C19E
MEAQRGFDRLVNLSDAVVAIAATLLILPLVDTAADIRSDGVGALVADHGSQLFAFALSFAVICRFWLIHHALFNRLVGYTVPLVSANFVWMASIAFLPFPTELVSFSGAGHPLTSALYVGTMCVASASTTVIQWIAIRNPALQDPEVRGTLTLHGSLAGTLAMVVALVIVLVIPAVGLWALLLLFPAGVIGDRLARRVRPTNT